MPDIPSGHIAFRSLKSFFTKLAGLQNLSRERAMIWSLQ
jgi:hypothetical protein